MIILDTNVISEPLRAAPAPAVLSWLDRQTAETLFLTTISMAEIRYGVALLPPGRRREILHEAIETKIAMLFDGRVLPFDDPASKSYARLAAAAKSAGANVSTGDAFIAAIAAAHGFAVATRDESPFEAFGVPVVNPWRQHR